MNNLVGIDDIVLKSGAHRNRQDGTCFMEAVAFIAGLPHSDHPECVCPTLGSFLRNLNDSISTPDRQLLKPYLRLVIGTAGDGFEMERCWLLVDWYFREVTSIYWEYLGFTELAAELRAKREVRDEESLKAIIDFFDTKAALAALAALAARRIQSSAFIVLDRMVQLGLYAPQKPAKIEPLLEAAAISEEVHA